MKDLPAGSWIAGKYYSNHTVSSTYLGKDENGRDHYDTTRTEMGEALYLLKYKQNRSAIDTIIKLLNEDPLFIEYVQQMDGLIAIPPSNRCRCIQPVAAVAERISHCFGVPLIDGVLQTSNVEQVKNLDIADRKELIDSSATVDTSLLERSKNYLIFDDLFSSGSTLTSYVEILQEKGYHNIYVLTLTRTR